MANIVEIDSNTWRFEDEYVRFFLLVGEEKAALIDSGVNCPDAVELAMSLTDKEIILINTHGDRDHASGTGSFPAIHIHSDDYYGCGLDANFPDTALASINDGDIIDLGHRKLRFIHIPGHTKGSVAILDISRRVLYAGDSVQKGHIYMFGNHRITEMYEESLDKLIGLESEFDYIFASHDEFKLPGDYTGKVKTAWRNVCDGKVDYEIIDLFGNKIKSYTTDVCGFYL